VTADEVLGCGSSDMQSTAADAPVPLLISVSHNTVHQILSVSNYPLSRQSRLLRTLINCAVSLKRLKTQQKLRLTGCMI